MKQKREDRLWYKGIKFSSMFEVEVARYLDQLNISWERNEKLFPANMDNGKVLHYLPDFKLYINDEIIYLESKGTWWSKDKRIKTYKAVEQNNLNWICIMLSDWQKSKRCLGNKLRKIKNDLSSRGKLL